MEQFDSDVPLPPAHVAIIYNLKKKTVSANDDEEAEYDSIDTVYAIRAALEKGGCRVSLFEADEKLATRLDADRPDIAFNIAEGIRGRGREAEVPALLNMYGIPFTGSDETTMCLALDKALAKRLVRSYGIRTPDYALIVRGGRYSGKLAFPIIVKPNAEGSSKGIREKCVVRDRAELDALIAHNSGVYGADMLAEQYIAGREFTVGVLGNGDDVRVFEPMEISFKHSTQDEFCVYSFGVKKDYKKHIEYRCPSDIPQKVRDEMIRASRRIYAILGCLDFARLDFRVSQDGTPYFIEANPLPGLAPEYSDYPMLAGFCGVSYDELVLSILKAAAARYGITV